MKRKLIIAACLLAVLFSTAALPADTGESYFAGIDERPLELSEPLWDFSVDLYI